MAKITLAQGSSVTLALGLTDSIRIESNRTGSAIVEAVTGIEGYQFRKRIVNHAGGTAEYGPFGFGTAKLSAVGGDIVYEQGGAESMTGLGAPEWATDASGNVTGLVGPGGDVISYSIRAAIEGAAGNNPWERDPWTKARPWTASTLYATGSLVRGTGANADNLYVLVGNAAGYGGSAYTSHASGGGPAGTSHALISDGTLYWMYHGRVTGEFDIPVWASVAPTLPTSVMDGYLAAVPYNDPQNVLGLTGFHEFTTAKPCVTLTGGKQTLADVVYPIIEGAPTGVYPGVVYNASSAAPYAEFVTDEHKWLALAVRGPIYQGRSVRISVNGRFLTEGCVVDMSATGSKSIVIDLTKFPKGNKTIGIYHQGDSRDWVFNFRTSPSSNIWAPKPKNNLKIVYEGDSVTGGGYFSGLVRSNIQFQASQKLGFSQWYNGAVGGTGLIAGAGTSSTYIQRIVEIEKFGAPDVLVVGGFHNDIVSPTASVNTALHAYLDAVRAKFPNTVVFVLGQGSLVASNILPGGSLSHYDFELNIKAQVASRNDAKMVFVPMTTDTPGFPASNAASSLYFTAEGGAYTDGHANHRYWDVYADRVVRAVREYFA